MRDGDSKLIGLLKANAREPAASLARKLGVAPIPNRQTA
jgi:hypothetical protein